MTLPRTPLRLLAFNLVLFLTLGAFAGFEVLDFLPGDGDVLIVVIVGSIIAAFISTAVHMRSVASSAEGRPGHHHAKSR